MVGGKDLYVTPEFLLSNCLWWAEKNIVDLSLWLGFVLGSLQIICGSAKMFFSWGLTSFVLDDPEIFVVCPEIVCSWRKFL